ncbi:MAG: D-alanyl-D-alanine carboxypeptidase/D-alanyl-D-alanine-endopeptidase [Prevotella sp.]|nr:D-alanyl-D-alanine carboxypeptidase/D-alanyl-D-alanine-endopeptidase [Prevotella sp.]
MRMTNRLITYYFLLLTFLSTASAQEQQPDSLCLRVDSVVRAAKMLETSQMGMLIYDLDGDSVLYARDAKQTMRPASTMKLLTAITALDKLGADYEYKTEVKCKDGDLFVIGAMDPLITEADLKMMADSLRAMGIDTIRGTIYADRSMKDSDLYGEGWCWDDDNPMLSPLVLNRKDNMVERLREILINDSIYLTGKVGVKKCPAEAETIYEIRYSLRDVLVPMMKQSNNLYAESMFYHIGLTRGRPSTAKKAKAVEEELLEKIVQEFKSSIVQGGVPPHRFADGSGLSLYNYVSAEMEIAFLRYAYSKEDIYNELIEALPIAGIDGTLKDRMKGTAAEGNVRAKTGTLSGVFSLAGYCVAGNGHRLAFAILNQGVMKGAYARGLQDRICIEMCK